VKNGWTHCYYMKICPRKAEEMVQIGILCYGSIFTFRDNLKQAILNHHKWIPISNDGPPIFDIYIGKLNSASKRQKCSLFPVKNPNRKKHLVFLKSFTTVQRKLTPMAPCCFSYRSRISLDFLQFHQKIQFNHEKYTGEETLFCIGGFQNLNNIIKLKNGKSLSI